MDPDEMDEAKFDYLLCNTRYARVCSKIMSRLYTATALARHAHKLIHVVADLRADLDAWRDTIPRSFRPSRQLQVTKLPNNVPFIQALVLHFSYHYAICTLHRRILWARRGPHQGLSPPLSNEISEAIRLASELSLESARTTILLTKEISIMSYTPSW
jgi:hypothetical protein